MPLAWRQPCVSIVVGMSVDRKQGFDTEVERRTSRVTEEAAMRCARTSAGAARSRNWRETNDRYRLLPPDADRTRPGAAAVAGSHAGDRAARGGAVRQR